MKAALAITLVLLVTGCATTQPARGSRLLPWNWFSSDSTAKVEKAEAKSAAAESSLRRDAQRNAIATAEAIAAEKARQLAAGGVSRELETAEDYAGRTVRSLDASEGFLAFDVRRELSEMVRLRNSQVDAERTRGDKLLAAADKIAQRSAEDKVASDAAIAAAHKKVAAEQQRALVAEEKYNRMWFWIYVAVGGIAFLKVLPVLAAAFPALAPIATAAGWIEAPLVQAGYSRLRKTVGGLIASAEKGGQLTADAIRAHLDTPLPEAEQRAIKAHYHKSQS